MKQANWITRKKNSRWTYLQKCKLTFGKLVSCIFIICLIVGCAPPTLTLPTATATLASTQTATPTVIWFQPTPTKTPILREEPTATIEMRPGIGEVIFEDDFSSPGAWLLEQSAKGTTAMGLNEITIAIVQTKAYMFSTRNEPALGDFYAEITTSPNLCTGLDEYGLLFRVRSQGDFYRYSLSCDGQVRLDRVVGGTARSPQPWLASASVPRGAPSSSRLGVWAVGPELRFFINGEFQFTVSDSYHDSGLFGVFARSAGENAVTIGFSDLKVYQIRQ